MVKKLSSTQVYNQKFIKYPLPTTYITHKTECKLSPNKKTSAISNSRTVNFYNNYRKLPQRIINIPLNYQTNIKNII